MKNLTINNKLEIMKNQKLTFSEIRKIFWENNPHFKNEYRKTYKQNQYNTDVRCAYTDFLEYLLANNYITENQSNKCTL